MDIGELFGDEDELSELWRSPSGNANASELVIEVVLEVLIEGSGRSFLASLVCSLTLGL